MARGDIVVVDRAVESDSIPSLPWFKFWVAAWMGDECLRMCSLGAHGLLAAFICLMHKAVPYGHLLVGGRKPTERELARLVGAAGIGELRRLQAELLNHGVLSVTSDGIIYSRRMVRSARLSAVGREAGRKGGNPALRSAKVDCEEPLTSRAGEPLTPTIKGTGYTKRKEERGENTDQNPLLPPDGESAGAIDARFERFWQAYPRREARKKALEYWRRIHPDDSLTDRIVAAVEQQKQSQQWSKESGRFIPLPATWLHGDRWNDVVIATTAPVPAVSGPVVPDSEATKRMLAQYKEDSWR